MQLETNKFSIREDDWKKFDKNNVAIDLNVSYVKKKKISCLCFKM